MLCYTMLCCVAIFSYHSSLLFLSFSLFYILYTQFNQTNKSSDLIILNILKKRVHQGNKEMVDIILNHNADPTMLNSRNETAKDMADVSGRKIISMAITEATC